LATSGTLANAQKMNNETAMDSTVSIERRRFRRRFFNIRLSHFIVDARR